MQIHKQTHATCAPHQHMSPVQVWACLWLLQHHAASLKHCLLRMPMCERLLALPHCVPVLSAGHTRKSRVTVSSLARFFLFEPVEQDLRAPVTGVCASSPPPPAQIIRGNVAHPVPAIALAPYSVCVWDVLYTHQIITEKLWTPSFCIWCMFKTLHISQWLWVPAVRDCVHSGQSLTTCNIHNIYNTNHAENNTLHKVPKHNLWPLCPQIFYVHRKEKTTTLFLHIYSFCL